MTILPWYSSSGFWRRLDLNILFLSLRRTTVKMAGVSEPESIKLQVFFHSSFGVREFTRMSIFDHANGGFSMEALLFERPVSGKSIQYRRKSRSHEMTRKFPKVRVQPQHITCNRDPEIRHGWFVVSDVMCSGRMDCYEPRDTPHSIGSSGQICSSSGGTRCHCSLYYPRRQV